MTLESLIPWLVYLPMLGFGITALVGRRLGRASGYIPVAAIFPNSSSIRSYAR